MPSLWIPNGFCLRTSRRVKRQEAIALVQKALANHFGSMWNDNHRITDFVLMQYQHKITGHAPYAMLRSFSAQGRAIAAYHVYKNTPAPSGTLGKHIAPGITEVRGAGTWNGRTIDWSNYMFVGRFP
ncbi:hypothetical protein HGRIS_002918 [Hohenbuehelia grisea]|uniref:Uncharacterized protein n=1 Tax=Hohenbuehelia grisea TaxID=104357 RepID=A0ABR3JMG6_9AGAR